MTPYPSEVALKLKTLREAAGLSLQKMADRLGLPLSTYRHYEERFKEPYLPYDLVEKLAVQLAGLGLNQADILALGLGPAAQSLAEDPALFPSPPKTATARVLEDLVRPKKSQSVPPELKIGTDGKLVQIIATVDRDGLADLIRKLETMKQLLD